MFIYSAHTLLGPSIPEIRREWLPHNTQLSCQTPWHYHLYSLHHPSSAAKLQTTPSPQIDTDRYSNSQFVKLRKSFLQVSSVASKHMQMQQRFKWPICFDYDKISDTCIKETPKIWPVCSFFFYLKIEISHKHDNSQAPQKLQLWPMPWYRLMHMKVSPVQEAKIMQIFCKSKCAVSDGAVCPWSVL